jgi:tetratricopeptide (TPR) repeat protein
MIVSKTVAPAPDDNRLCGCGSGRAAQECCGTGDKMVAKLIAPPNILAKPFNASPLHYANSVLPEHVSRRLNQGAEIRRQMDFQASLRLKPKTPPRHRPKGRQVAAQFLEMAAALRQGGRLAESIRPLQQAIAASPDDVNPYYDLGLTLSKCMRHAEAIGPLRRAIELKPDFGKAYYALGEVYDALGRINEAVATLRRAIEFMPNFAEAHRTLGILLHRSELLAEAKESFRKAADFGRNTTLGRVCQSFVLSEDGKFAEAAEVLRQALARDPTHHLACVTLGHALANMGEIDAAIAQFQRALTLPDDPVVTWASLLQIKKMTEADRPLVAEIEAHLQNRPLLQTARMTLNFTLGKAYDDLRDYEQAIQHYDAANRIRRTLCPFDRDGLSREVDAVTAEFTPRFFAEHSKDGLDDETPLLVLGMPRSGTTLVEQVLSSHPLIAGAGELTFWYTQWMALRTAGTRVADAATARQLATDYLALLRSFSPTATRVVDKGLSNFQWIGLILQALPNTRIVHCRRHPIDTCLSIYFTQFEAIRGFISDRDDLVFYYREYVRIMDHWRAVLPPERFFEVDYEAMIAEPEETARALINFAGLEWDPACLRPEENRRGIKTASIWQARQPIYRTSLERWRRYEPWLGSLRELMPQHIQASST